MAKKDPRIDAYIAKAQPFAKPILKHIRKVVHAAWPDVEETIKWGHPSFDYKGPLCGMAGFKAHATFGVWKGPLIKERVPGMPGASGQAWGHFGRLTSIKDLPSTTLLSKIVRVGAQLNDEKISIPRPKAKPKPAIATPPYFAAALKKNKKAAAVFEAFAPSHRREYLLWILEAKSDDTRDRRVAQAIAWIAEGKGRNWKYERK